MTRFSTTLLTTFILICISLFFGCKDAGNTGEAAGGTTAVPSDQSSGGGSSGSEDESEITELSATTSNGDVTLTWENPNTNSLDHCEVWYGTDGTADTQFTGTVDPAGTTISGTSTGTEYLFTVKAKNTFSSTLSSKSIQLMLSTVSAQSGATVTLDSGYEVEFPSDTLTEDTTVSVAQAEPVSNINTVEYSPWNSALQVDLGGAELEGGKTFVVDIPVSASNTTTSSIVSASADNVTTSATDSTRYAVLAYRKNSEEPDYLAPKESSDTGYISVDVWYEGAFQPVSILREESDVTKTKPFIATWIYDIRTEIDGALSKPPESNEFCFSDKKMHFYGESYFDDNSTISWFIHYTDIDYVYKESLQLPEGNLYLMEIYFTGTNGLWKRDNPSDDFYLLSNFNNSVFAMGIYFRTNDSVYMIPGNGQIISMSDWNDETYETAKQFMVDMIDTKFAGVTGNPNVIDGVIPKLNKK